MVFFTCNACGQSIKKNRVEKHWQTECPKCEVLSCMDCGKDFYGDEYAAHTSCISEAEKYQGALFKGEKGGQTKGDRKQKEWVENVRQAMSSGHYSPKISRLLEMIAEYPNIPRKKTKFENFIKNSINVRDQSTANTLWEIFSGACSVSQQCPQSAPVKEMKAKPDQRQDEAETLQCTESCSKVVNGFEEKMKKKHKRRQKGTDTAEEEINSPKEELKKKKQKKRKKDCENDTLLSDPNETCSGRPEKKRKSQLSEPAGAEDVVHPVSKRIHTDNGKKHKHKHKRTS